MDKKLRKKAQVGIEVLVILGILVVGAIIFGGYYLNTSKWNVEQQGKLDTPSFQPNEDPINPTTDLCNNITAADCNADLCSCAVCMNSDDCTSVSPPGFTCSDITNSSQCSSHTECCGVNTTYCPTDNPGIPACYIAPATCGDAALAANPLTQCVTATYYSLCCVTHNSACSSSPACHTCGDGVCQNEDFWKDQYTQEWFNAPTNVWVFKASDIETNDVDGCPKAPSCSPLASGDCACPAIPEPCVLGLPIFTPAGNTFPASAKPLTVILSHDNYTNCNNIQIRYTTNGTTPTLLSPNYGTTPIPELNADTNITARLFAKDATTNADVNGSPLLQQYKFDTSPIDLCSGANGNGNSMSSPWQIRTPLELSNIRNNLTKHYILCNDIDLNVSPYNAEPGWEPLGGTFTGSLNGNHKKIQNLYAKDNANDLGLFDTIGLNARVFNLDLEYPTLLLTNGNIGTLAAKNNGGIIENVTVISGLIMDNSPDKGGLIGIQSAGRISNCSVSIQLLTNHDNGNNNGDRIGGLVGTLNGGIVEDSSVWGDSSTIPQTVVTGNNGIGGLIGLVDGPTSTTIVRRCSVIGNNVSVNGGNAGKTGGLIGWLKNGTLENSYAMISVNDGGGLIGVIANGGTVNHCYSAGAVSAGGGLIGSGSGTINTYSYWNTQTSGRNTSSGGTYVVGKTTLQMHNDSNYSGWGINLVSSPWLRDSEHNNGYPYIGAIYNQQMKVPVLSELIARAQSYNTQQAMN